MLRRRAVPFLLAALVGVVGVPAAAAAATDPVAPARAYVAALVSHDGSGVPLTDDATRVEAGLQTGFSGPQIRADLTYGPQYRVIQAVRDERYSVDGDVVTADYVLDVGLPGLILLPAAVHETFVIRDGQIAAIVADITIGERGPITTR